MGTWGMGSFDNDTACDWAGSLQDTDDGLAFVQKTLQHVLDTEQEYIECPDAEEAITAAEVVARLNGNFGVRDSYTELVDEWVATHPQKPSLELLSLAVRAINRILTPPSEIVDLWQENDNYFTQWQANIHNLLERITK